MDVELIIEELNEELDVDVEVGKIEVEMDELEEERRLDFDEVTFTVLEIEDEIEVLELVTLVVVLTVEDTSELEFPRTEDEPGLTVAKVVVEGVKTLTVELRPKLPYPLPSEKLGSPVYDEVDAPTVVDELLETADAC